MAKRKVSLKFVYDAPVTITFSIICIVVFLVDNFILKNYLSSNLLISPTNGEGLLPFSFTGVLSYPRLFLYIFSSSSIELLLVNLVFILLLGPTMEERYGSVVIGIMIAVAALFSGVLTACFCKESLVGASPIVFMMIFLNAFMSISKKKFPISFIVILGIIIALEFINKGKSGLVTILIEIAGGLCGSLFACLASPRARAEKKYNKKVEEIDAASPRFKKADSDKTITIEQNPKKSNNDETVIGTIKF